jgi:hypothetical protein
MSYNFYGSFGSSIIRLDRPQVEAKLVELNQAFADFEVQVTNTVNILESLRTNPMMEGNVQALIYIEQELAGSKSDLKPKFERFVETIKNSVSKTDQISLDLHSQLRGISGYTTEQLLDGRDQGNYYQSTEQTLGGAYQANNYQAVDDFAGRMTAYAGSEFVAEARGASPVIANLSSNIPSGDTSFHSWMGYRAITNRRSGQWKLQQDPNTITDPYGLRRHRSPDNPDGDIIIALGNAFGTTIGTRYRVTMENGHSFYAMLGDVKGTGDYNSVNVGGQSVAHRHGNRYSVVEFVVDRSNLHRDASRMGNVGALPQFNGNVLSIEKVGVNPNFPWG